MLVDLFDYLPEECTTVEEAAPTKGRQPLKEALLSPEKPPFFVQPHLREIEPALVGGSTPHVITVAAQGAVGKTTLAHRIAHTTGCPLIGLEHLTLGSGTFNGVLAECFGFAGAQQLLDQMSAGTSFIVMDSLDEAVMRSGGPNQLEAFCESLGSALSASEPVSPMIVIFGREPTMSLASMVLEEQELTVMKLQLDYFDQNLSNQFMYEYLNWRLAELRSSVETKRQRISDCDVHVRRRDEFEDTCNRLFSSIASLIGYGEPDGEFWTNRTVRTFIGYAPVLMSIATLIDDAFIDADDSADAADSLWATIARLARQIVERESRKYSENLGGLLVPAANSDDLVPASAQVQMLLDPDGVASAPEIPDSVAPDKKSDFEQAIKEFARQHPFLEVDGWQKRVGDRFSNAVFLEYLLACALTSDDPLLIENTLEEFKPATPRITAMLSRFCLALADDDPISSQSLPLVLSSLMVSRTADGRDKLADPTEDEDRSELVASEAQVSLREEGLDEFGNVVIVVTVADNVDAQGALTGKFIADPNDPVLLMSDLSRLDVDLPGLTVRVGDGSPLTIGREVSITAKRVEMNTELLTVLPGPAVEVKSQGCVITADFVAEMGLQSLPSFGPRVPPDLQSHALRIRAAKADYPWREYREDPPVEHPHDKYYDALMSLRSIVNWFGKLGRARDGQRQAYRRPVDASLGKGRLDKDFFGYCMSTGLISTAGVHDYLLNLEAFGLNYQSIRLLDLADESLLRFISGYVNKTG